MKCRRLHAAILVLLCSGITSAARLGGIELGMMSRGLLQRSLDCAQVNSGCQICRNQRQPGSKTTELVCSTCKPGYKLRRDGRSKTCDCAPGFYLDSSNVCSQCPQGKYCPGWDEIIIPDNAALDCGEGLTTFFIGAKSISQCFTVAGYGRNTVRGSQGAVTYVGTACPIGTYNVGGNTAGCQKCPAGLTTAANSSTSAADCLAPAGSYMDRGIGKLCPKGTFNQNPNSNASCSACPPGITTAAAEGNRSPFDCKQAVQGYYMVDATTAAPCPVDTYSDNSTLGVGDSCTPCPNGMKTTDPGATGKALCLAPPGYELRTADGVITECENGWYKVDWNRNNCTYCGDGLITNSTGSVTKDACLVPAGSGITQISPIASAAICSHGTFGTNVNQPTSAASHCTACPSNTQTPDQLGGPQTTTGYTDATDCKVAAGYGLTESGLAELCPKGTYNEGGNRNPCKACGAGFTTVAEGRNSSTQCVIQPGWEWRAAEQKAHPCDAGTWSPGGTQEQPLVTCIKCSDKGAGYGSQTDETAASAACDVCGAGYGGDGCTECPFDTFSSRGNKDGMSCSNCPAGTVSARRSTETAMCYPQFIRPDNDVFSLIGDATDSGWFYAHNVNNSADCQASCLDIAPITCFMYKFDVQKNLCYLVSEETVPGMADTKLGFKISSGADYVMYGVNNNWKFGVTVGADTKVADLNACSAKCSANNACEAFLFTASGICGLRKSELDSEYQGMFRVVNSHLKFDIDNHP